MQAADGPLRCLCCQMTDPPPDRTCHQGRDHRVGFTAGCPGCGRLAEACARRPCTAVRLAASRAGLPGWGITSTLPGRLLSPIAGSTDQPGPPG